MKMPALRATARIAWRGGRRHLRRSSLIFVMIGLPVALVTASATIARTTVKTPQEEVAGMMGGADLVFQSPTDQQLQRFQRKLPEGSVVAPSRAHDLSFVHDGRLVDAAIVEPGVSLDHPILAGLYELDSGRGPRTAGEVALQEDLLERLEVGVGDRVELGGYELTVVGTAHYPYALDKGLAVVGSETLRSGASASNVLVDLPRGVRMDTLDRFVQNLTLTRQEVGDVVINDAAVWDAVSLTGGLIALFATGLIAAAAFVVGARRQLRELGIIGAAGGEPRHARAVVLLGGTTLGLAGGLMGAVAGLGLAHAAHPFLDDLLGRVVGPVDVNVLVLVAAVLMGTLAATVAALGPARAVARLSVVEALAGRSAPPQPPGRIAALGAVALFGGGIVSAWATVSSSNAILAGGVIVMLLGVLFAIPLLVSLVGKIASRLPLSARMAARDAARHGRRTGAAVAAAVIALGIPVAVATYSLSEEAFERRSPRIGDDQLYFSTVDGSVAIEPEGFAADVEKAFPDAIVAPLTKAVVPSRRPGGEPSVVFAFGATDGPAVTPPPEPGAAATSVFGFELFVGDSQLLRAVHAESGDGALAQGKALVLGGFGTKNGAVRIETPTETGRGRRVPAVAVASPSYFNESIPRIVISSDLAAELGLEEQEHSRYLLTAPGPLSDEDVERARAVAADHPGFYVWSAEDYLPRFGVVRGVVTGATLPLGLAILAVAVALVSSESRRSRQILAAVGAGPITHRKVAASTSALLALIAAVLAIPAGIFPTLVVQVSSGAGRPLVIPWLTLATVLVVAPFASGVVAALTSRAPRLGSLLTPSN